MREIFSKPPADVLVRLETAGIASTGAADHGVSEALYLNDPDGNGIELYWDRPESQWRTADGQLAMVSRTLDLDHLRRAASGSSAKVVGSLEIKTNNYSP